ncbi:unnamed protein product [Didymodactylos carnosus]|uniref:Uncharacterized protein n=1 Tax=Didymodactylos carnosus TaxID=1234261 RepID=A0A8S2DJF5_9BILA|nr:unnamed protein product [Didymodactylos carnosus]CAF3697598.1 unnamed protein product [Didymodactylos carnosus]
MLDLFHYNQHNSSRDRTRHFRIDLTSKEECEKLLNAREISLQELLHDDEMKAKALCNPTLINNFQQQHSQQQIMYKRNEYNAWPLVNSNQTKTMGSTEINESIWDVIKHLQSDFEKMKLEHERKENEMKIKYIDQMNKYKALVVLNNIQTKTQDEMIKNVYTVVEETLPAVKTTLQIVKFIASKIASMVIDLDEQENMKNMFELIETTIAHLTERSEMLSIKIHYWFNT